MENISVARCSTKSDHLLDMIILKKRSIQACCRTDISLISYKISKNLNAIDF